MSEEIERNGGARHVAAGRQVGVFVALLVLTTATLLLSFAPLGAFHTAVAMAIAATKGALIVFFFMHLVEQERINGLVLLASLLLVVAFVGLTAADVGTRRSGPTPPAVESLAGNGARPLHARGARAALDGTPERLSRSASASGAYR